MLTDAQKRACKMLFENGKVQDVAKELGVHRCTIWRWSQTRDFQKEWTRLNRNYRRRLRNAELRAYEILEKRQKEMFGFYDEKLQKARPKAGQKPKKGADRAYEAWSKALFGEKLVAELRKRLKS